MEGVRVLNLKEFWFIKFISTRGVLIGELLSLSQQRHDEINTIVYKAVQDGKWFDLVDDFNRRMAADGSQVGSVFSGAHADYHRCTVDIANTQQAIADDYQSTYQKRVGIGT